MVTALPGRRTRSLAAVIDLVPQSYNFDFAVIAMSPSPPSIELLVWLHSTGNPAILSLLGLLRRAGVDVWP